jgi:hypothetical protein
MAMRCIAPELRGPVVGVLYVKPQHAKTTASADESAPTKSESRATAVAAGALTGMRRPNCRCAALALILAAAPIASTTADQIYPPGTECANLRTIAERLLCGRQELKRGDAGVQQQQNVPPPPYDGYSPDPDEAQPPPGVAPTVPSPAVPESPGAPIVTPQQP